MERARHNVVAIIDDDPAVLDSLQFLLIAAGYEVLAFGSAEAFLRADPPHVACLVADQQMPDMTGLELIERRQDGVQATPALLVSSALTRTVSERAAALGASTLAKPLDEDDLLRFVAEHAAPAPST